jgi:hypothetical protein
MAGERGIFLVGYKPWLTAPASQQDRLVDCYHFLKMLQQRERWFPEAPKASPMCNIVESLPHVATFGFTAGALRAEQPAYLKYGTGKLCIGSTNWRAIGVFE